MCVYLEAHIIFLKNRCIKNFGYNLQEHYVFFTMDSWKELDEIVIHATTRLWIDYMSNCLHESGMISCWRFLGLTTSCADLAIKFLKCKWNVSTEFIPSDEDIFCNCEQSPGSDQLNKPHEKHVCRKMLQFDEYLLDVYLQNATHVLSLLSTGRFTRATLTAILLAIFSFWRLWKSALLWNITWNIM